MTETRCPCCDEGKFQYTTSEGDVFDCRIKGGGINQYTCRRSGKIAVRLINLINLRYWDNSQSTGIVEPEDIDRIRREVLGK